MRDYETSMAIARYDTLQEARKWLKELPPLHFKQEWNVKIIPPFGGAIIRFWIEYKGRKISVYFDAYDELGFVGQPYFECYDGEACARYLLNESGNMMKDIEEFLEQD